MLSCILTLCTILGIPVAVTVAGVGPKRVWRIVTSPHKVAVVVGEWFMVRYLALEPLNEVEHVVSIIAIPIIFGVAIWINFLP